LLCDDTIATKGGGGLGYAWNMSFYYYETYPAPLLRCYV